MDSGVDGELKCPICLDLFTHPIILPCSHVLCREPCADTLFDGNFIRCPVCRDTCYIGGGIATLPRVLALENIIEKLKENASSVSISSSLQSKSVESSEDEDDAESLPAVSPEYVILCQLCENNPRKAKKSCLDCNASYCGRCLRISHPVREPFTSHKLVSPHRTEVTPREIICHEHGASLTFYCHTCRKPGCLVCEETRLHIDHRTATMEHAYEELKVLVTDSLEKLESSHQRADETVKMSKDALQKLQTCLCKLRGTVNAQCDLLVNEVESKRSFFIADLDYEERIRQSEIENVLRVLERTIGSSHSLCQYAHEKLEKTDASAFLLLSSSITDRLSQLTLDCDSYNTGVPRDIRPVEIKVVDFRKERAVLQDMHYLLIPATPIIDIARCSRSHDSVALAVSPPKNTHDVIDFYQVHFYTEEQKEQSAEDISSFRSPQEDRQLVKGMSNSGHLVLILPALKANTTYYFYITVSNRTGESGTSEVVQCSMLNEWQITVPAPLIVDGLCRRFTSSIQVFSTSPMDPFVFDQNIVHHLLFRVTALSPGAVSHVATPTLTPLRSPGGLMSQTSVPSSSYMPPSRPLAFLGNSDLSMAENMPDFSALAFRSMTSSGPTTLPLTLSSPRPSSLPLSLVSSLPSLSQMMMSDRSSSSSSLTLSSPVSSDILVSGTSPSSFPLTYVSPVSDSLSSSSSMTPSVIPASSFSPSSAMTASVPVPATTSNSSHSIPSLPSIASLSSPSMSQDVDQQSPQNENIDSNSEIIVSNNNIPNDTDISSVWRSVALYKRQEHRVFGLEPGTKYEFMIIACNPNGECRLSNSVALKTEESPLGLVRQVERQGGLGEPLNQSSSQQQSRQE